MVVFKNFLPNVMAITAIGIEAVTVRPAFNARYTVEEPKRIPKREPNTIDFTVNSAILDSGETYGLKVLSSIGYMLVPLSNIYH
jgi:hypothetical protein